MSVMVELVRLVGQVLAYAWSERRPLLPVFVVVVGLAALLALALGAVAPVAIYPLL